ncbi:transposase [Desulfofarcimen acetoxidans]|uniref:transposase n=1 Tax=Desulfofarcimen acetoxidans TaxID=58138 RepID=UPI0005AB2AE3|nr:transposase [Desulfofarcimen acetoxidans]
MPRKPRVWYPGATYHVMCRGNHRHNIFRDEEDYQSYLLILAWAKKSYRFLLHSYCLMSNHVHLHLETSDMDISKIMKLINMQYAVSFNKKYNFVGHLFQGRFRDELIKTDNYQLEISRYIHLNPVDAHIVEHPLDYPWSSYSVYMGVETDPLVTTEKILAYFPNSDASLYKKYVETPRQDRRKSTLNDQ